MCQVQKKMNFEIPSARYQETNNRNCEAKILLNNQHEIDQLYSAVVHAMMLNTNADSIQLLLLLTVEARIGMSITEMIILWTHLNWTD